MTERTKEAVEAATTSCERVTRQAKRITKTLSARSERARTDPFEKVEMTDDDSMVTSIEKVISTVKKE